MIGESKPRSPILTSLHRRFQL